LRARAEALETVFGSLLSKLMTGSVRVPVEAEDETP
jgi:glyceraldehyde-3-phosphate dehydrogenase/erythrose-4-phosphate dehydrogenase